MKGMEKIELAIKIQKAYYELVLERCKDPVLLNAFKNGTLLPKGHGRLIDADAFIKTLEDASKRQNYKDLLIDNNLLTVDDVFNAVIESLQNEGLANNDAPTIIEADKESEDKS